MKAARPFSPERVNSGTIFSIGQGIEPTIRVVRLSEYGR
jgi:hypothetical protein